ncbi:MAG: hypothetical protein ABIJ59_18500 [Pseudomonadota bacterium]
MPGFWYPGALIPRHWNNLQDFCTFFQVKRKLPEHQVHEIFKEIRKSSFVTIVILVADAKILFDYIPLF